MKPFVKYPVLLLTLLLVGYSQVFTSVYWLEFTSVSTQKAHLQTQNSKAADCGISYFEEEQEEEDKLLFKRFFQTLASDLFYVQLPDYLFQSIVLKKLSVVPSLHFSLPRASYLVLSVFRL